MKHPSNKKDRLTIGNTKAKKRSYNKFTLDAYYNLIPTSKCYRDTTKKCSCACCGNRRKHWNELTMQEQKNLEKDITDEYEIQ